MLCENKEESRKSVVICGRVSDTAVSVSCATSSSSDLFFFLSELKFEVATQVEQLKLDPRRGPRVTTSARGGTDCPASFVPSTHLISKVRLDGAGR